MKNILIFILLLCCSPAYAAYTGTMPKDIGTSTPLGSENPNVIDDAIRERGTILLNLYKIRSIATDYTLSANDSWVIVSSAAPVLITMPSASSVANGTATKPFVIKNVGNGTVTLNITVDGVGSPTISGSQTMCLFTNGTTWYETGVKNAYNSNFLGGTISTGYALSGANSNITSLTGLTTALPISEGGTGQTTAATAATAIGVGTGNTPQFTGLNVTGSGTVTTLNATTGNITNISATAGTFTGNMQVDSMSGLEDADIPNDITLTNITQITNRSHNNITGTGTYSHASIDAHIDDTSDPHGGNLTQTNAAITTGTVTTLYSTTGNITNLNTTGNGTITTLGVTTITGTTGNITNISATAGTFTGNMQASSVSGFDYVSKWRSGSTVGTGTVAIQGSGDIIVTPSYSNANGTITISIAGSASAKPNIKYNAAQIIGNATDIDFNKGLVVVGSGSTEAVVSIGNISLGTQTTGLLSLGTQTTGLLSLGTQTTGLLSLGTQTTGLLSLGTQTTGLLSLGTQTTGLLSLGTQTNGTLNLGWSDITTGTLTGNTDITGTPTANKLVMSTSGNLNNWIDNTIISIPGTTTQIAGTASSGRWYNLQGTANADIKLLLHCNNPSSSTFVDSSAYIHTITANGNAVGAATAKFGSGGGYFDGTGDYLTSSSSTDFVFGTGDFTVEAWINPSTIAGSLRTIVSNRDGEWSATEFCFKVQPDATIALDTGTAQLIASTATVSLSTWTHVAVARSGSNLMLFINGSKDNQVSNSSNFSKQSTLKIGGSDPGESSTFNGYIDEIRISKGVAKWTSNFTPPVLEYNYESNTLQYIPPGMTSAALLISDDRYILNNVTTVGFGYSTTTAMTGTSSIYKIRCIQGGGGVLADSLNTYSTGEIKNIIDKGSRSSFLDTWKNLRIEEWYHKKQAYINNPADLAIAENNAKEKYKQRMYQEWYSRNGGEYMSNTYTYRGSSTSKYINEAKLKTDYDYYGELLWASDLKKDKLIEAERLEIESDTSKINVSLIVNDPSTPSYMKTSDGIGRDLGSELGSMGLALQELIARYEEQQKEIEELKLLLGKQ